MQLVCIILSSVLFLAALYCTINFVLTCYLGVSAYCAGKAKSFSCTTKTIFYLSLLWMGVYLVSNIAELLLCN